MSRQVGRAGYYEYEKAAETYFKSCQALECS